MKKLMLSCTAIMFCAAILAQNPATLKMNLEKNKVYRLKSVTEQSVTQTINGVQQTTESKVNYTMSLKMIDATADYMVTEVRFDTLLTYTNAMGKTDSFSSVSAGDISCLSCERTRNPRYTARIPGLRPCMHSPA